MKYEVDGWNNFCRVFRLPEEYPNGFCHGGGRPVNFQMVDWFYPVPNMSQSAVSKDIWREQIGDIEVVKVDSEELFQRLIPFLKQKNYVSADIKFLVICDFGASFIFTG